ncbi:CheR family methyltransferase [Paenibacillus chartarius]|uniref:CheR family methyltransferase n=1 Tax=Paenibacillus chartarius TaxID=747481 RepID=A0ABV6DGK5_9BACL
MGNDYIIPHVPDAQVSRQSHDDSMGLEVPFYVVGIGASAGGLEALEVFFDHMEPNSGMAFVVIQHLSPNYRSFMAELLSARTSMQIIPAEHRMKVMPNCVYLIPPRKTMTISKGRLELADSEAQTGMTFPIDLFLRSLAQDCGERAIAIILSGTGSDGSRGIVDVKQAGGMVLVQDDQSAKFDGMPNSAKLTGIVDQTLAPQHMPQALLQHIKVLAENGFTNSLPGNTLEKVNMDLHLNYIFDLIKQASGIDFNYYKRNSVYRRLERRMVLNNISSLGEYTEFLYQNPMELAALRKDLLIGVTHFFRDPEAFHILRVKALPLIFKEKEADKEIRVWVAGCSTGEEAYSVAILFKRYMEQHNVDYTVKIFATDLDKESIEFAGQGLYPESTMKNMPSELLERYFVKEDDLYRVTKEIRKMVLFAPHNIIKDPPFSNLDLITCRNMLIYLQSEMQRKVLSLFHFVLNPKGFLFLGPSESIGRLTNQFESTDRRWNIFQHKRANHQDFENAMDVRKELEGADKLEKMAANRVYPSVTEERQYKKADDLYKILVEEHMYPCMLIDENNDIIHLSGKINPYLNLAKGKPSWNLHKMLNPHLSVAIATAVQKVRKDHQPEIVYKNVKAAESEPELYVNLFVRPFSKKFKTTEKLVLVEIQQAETLNAKPRTGEEMEYDVASNVSQRVIDLEFELQRAEETLQATIEELETSNEELQATNEELVAANEELQSTNEELQSVNEELITVNTEYQYKIQELTDLNNDMNNLFVSTNIATVFLDKNMCVRRFTPAVTKEINLMEIDHGRPIAHISHNFYYDEMVEDARRVLLNVTPVEREVESKTGHWYIMRMLPYRTLEQHANGIVITFIDITELKLANNELIKLSNAIEKSPSVTVIADAAGYIEYMNPYFTELTGYSQDELLGKPIWSLNEWSATEPSLETVQKLLSEGRMWQGELENRKKNGEVYWESVKLLPVKDRKGHIVQYLKVAEDITEQKLAEELLRKSEMLSAVGQLAAGIAHEIRNPLTALKGFTKLMATSESNRSYISIMLDELTRIEDIVSELLFLAKPQAVDFKSNDLGAIMGDVMLIVDTQAIMSNVEIKMDIEDQLPTVYGVENQLKQVFINLLKNAIEAMPNGGQIRIDMKQHSSEGVQIVIADNGVGIPEEKLARLGEPFYSTKEKGTGLGLMVTLKIIENHRGTVTFTSELGKGTVVQILLPVK